MFFTKVDTSNVNVAKDVAGHDFEVEKHYIHTETGLLIPDHVAIIRKDTGAYLGTVGKAWEPVQPDEIYELAEELMKYSGGVINGVFTMFGGSLIGISFTLATREYVQGDPTDLNFLMITAFDGSHGIAGLARFAGGGYSLEGDCPPHRIRPSAGARIGNTSSRGPRSWSDDSASRRRCTRPWLRRAGRHA